MEIVFHTNQSKGRTQKESPKKSDEVRKHEAKGPISAQSHKDDGLVEVEPINPLTFDQFIRFVYSNPKKQHYRLGMLVSQDLRALRPDLYDKSVGTKNDPYFHEGGHKLDKCLDWLRENWGK